MGDGNQNGIADLRTSLVGQMKITYPSDLNCHDFSALQSRSCRWRNEWTNTAQGDEMDWIRMYGHWGNEQGMTIFGTEKHSENYFLLTGTQKKQHAEHSAMLVSDPIQCQEGDGLLSFKYWTSPSAKVRVCTRPASMGKRYDWCSEDITIGDPGPAQVVIPGSIMCTFEIVIEARNFVLDAFGFRGGVVAIDDICYNATAIYNCKNIPHYEPLAPLEMASCEAVTCNFDSGKCLKRVEDTDWKLAREAVGSWHTGIRQPLRDTFAYVKGPGIASFSLGPFTVPRVIYLEFCYYSSSRDGRLLVYLTIDGSEQRTKSFESTSTAIHAWICERTPLQPAKYQSVEFSSEHLSSEHMYLGVDQISFVDPATGTDMCTFN